MKDFSPISEQARPGDLVLVRHDGPNDVLSDGVEWFSGGEVSHCFICLGDGTIVEALPVDGVVIRPLSKYFKAEYTLIQRRIGAPYSVMYANSGGRIATAAMGLLGSRYDLSQIAINAVYFILGKLKLNSWQLRVARQWRGWKGGYTCSESCATAVWDGIKVNIFPELDNFGLVTPQDLLESGSFVTINRI